VASYRVAIKRTAAKEIESIAQNKVRQQLIDRIGKLSANPRPPGCEKLSGQHVRYRIRQGRYRILYEIQDRELVVFVVKVAHRREVYRDTH